MSITQETIKTSAPVLSCHANVKSLTPAMRQYVEQKQRVGEAILLFRMGDFYETFYEDAVLCSKVLGIALTSRSKADNPIPLAGIPYHALDAYLKKLIAAGYAVAISEQMEDAKQAKGVVKREVVRLITAGTLTDESLLDEAEDNVLACVCSRDRKVGLATIELASGRFEVFDLTEQGLLDELVRIRPAELVIENDAGPSIESLADDLRRSIGTQTTKRPSYEFVAYQAERALLDHFNVQALEGFGISQITPAVCAAGAVLSYLQETQKTALDHIQVVTHRSVTDILQIDHHSWRSLEIDRTLRSGSREGTLLHAIDQTVHPIGGRKLRHWLCAGLTNVNHIVHRQAAITYLVDDGLIRRHIRDSLKNLADIERIVSRVALARATPRDLAALGQSLLSLPHIVEQVIDSDSAFVAEVAYDLQGLDDLAALLERSIVAGAAAHLRDGGVIADGVDNELDRLRSISKDGKQWLAAYQSREIERTGIGHLKVGYNRVFGYYIEVPNGSKDKVPAEYVRKQTIKSAERYITDELKQHETELLTASDRAIELEQKLFETLRVQVAKDIDALMRVADAMGRLDIVAALAELAVQRRYVKPEFVDGVQLEIHDGRHPVLDQVLSDSFVPNDTMMTDESSRVFVITGPNMAGKSTYIRQVALLTLLAQIGSYVPAGKMKLSAADRIFARVGASDEIMRGQSTFMVEMTEAANVLHYATKHSLVVLDELGRGTSTFDGLSLAWAITEHLTNNIKCRSLVATHYHEMTELENLLAGVKNYNVAIREYSNEDSDEQSIVFLYRIVPGRTSKSYGLHVAKLAGIPSAVIARSQEVLDELEKGLERECQGPRLAKMKTKDIAQLQLFRDPSDELLTELASANLDAMTPLEALQKLTEWKTRYR